VQRQWHSCGTPIHDPDDPDRTAVYVVPQTNHNNPNLWIVFEEK